MIIEIMKSPNKKGNKKKSEAYIYEIIVNILKGDHDNNNSYTLIIILNSSKVSSKIFIANNFNFIKYYI